jgi:hypothetical protein
LALTEAEFRAFKALIDEPHRQTERECQNYLSHAANLLLPGTPVDTTTITEERNYFGTADFIIAATIRDDANRNVRSAYIWELKAPQCYLFERDNANRCRATDDFLKAENQLLHYTHQAIGDQTFRARMQVMDHTNIRIGGIVIGTRERFMRGSTGSMDIQKADIALQVRELYLYKSHGIRVLTWDRVLDYVRPFPA